MKYEGMQRHWWQLFSRLSGSSNAQQLYNNAPLLPFGEGVKVFPTEVIQAAMRLFYSLVNSLVYFRPYVHA